jgi:polysaccharide export outer membrane protein
MNRSLLLILVPALASLIACSHDSNERRQTITPPSDILPDETVGVDDVLEVRVVGEGDLSGAFRVGMDGTVDYPYVGRLELAGLRPGEIQQLLTRKLKDGLLVSPQISITVKEWNSRKLSVLGQVNKPGPVSYYPRMTIIDAIAAAGGFTPLAAQNSVTLRRETNGKVETETLRVNDISQGRKPNVVVRPRDLLFVDERMF